jgi:hypothetical protein
MKPIISSFFVLASCQLCFSRGDANVIAMSEWSKPISLPNEQLHNQDIRGRLLIVQGMEPAYGGPPTTNGAMTFVELQNVTGAQGEGIDVYFAVTNLHCQLSDRTGKALPEPGGVAWGGRGPFAPYWLRLPYNSTVRLFINGGSMNPLMVYPSGEPWRRWSIAADSTNAYFLSGTLNLSTHTNLSLSPEFREPDYQLNRKATLEFPKMRIRSGKLSRDRAK